MAGTIRAVNLPGKGANGAIYIARPWRGVVGSPLGNPRKVGAPRAEGGVWTAGHTLLFYEPELRAALDRSVRVAMWNGERLTDLQRERMRAVMNDLYQRVRSGEDVLVDCHCKGARTPNAPCHGDIIVKLVLEKIAERAVRRA